MARPVYTKVLHLGPMRGVCCAVPKHQKLNSSVKHSMQLLRDKGLVTALRRLL